MDAVIIYGTRIEPKVGAYVVPEQWRFGNLLQASDWRRAQFRLPTNSGGPISSLAVNISITGRTIQRRQGDNYIRVNIEFVGDGEPSTFASGWMKV